MIGTDPKTDLALIKVDGRTDFPFVTLAEKAPRIGDWVLAVGNPFGLGGTVTAGIVSARGRDIGAGPYDDFIQIDAPVNKGNSGGPTFDVDGNVIGVNTAIYSPSGGSVGIAFAIPADTVKTVVTQLKDKGAVTRGWIGVQIQPVNADIADSLGLKKAEGALVAEPQADGPAAKAGIQSGDVITSVNGQPVKDARDLAKKISQPAARRRTSSSASSARARRRPSPSRSANCRASSVRRAPTRTSATTVPAPRCRGSASRSRRPARSRAPAPKASWSRRSIRTVRPPAQGFRTGDVILDVAGKRVDEPGRRPQGLRRCARRRQAHRSAAREVGREHAVRRGPARTRLIVAPA